jgi:hypothetical protein
MDAFVDLIRPQFGRMTFVLKHLVLVFASVLVWAGCTYMGLVQDIDVVLGFPAWFYWWYLAQFLGVVVAIASIVGGYLMYTGYTKMKDNLKGLDGIPMPPIQHQVLGH